MGRPLKFETVEELRQKIVEYFKNCEEKKRPLTITGLAVALDTCRDTLIEYEGREDFSDTIKKAKEIIHNFTEEKLFDNKINAAGIIFNLKNNWGWKDKTEVDQNTNIKAQGIKFVVGVPEDDK